MREYYYIDENEQQKGPVDIKALLQSGIKPETRIWYEGQNTWVSAIDVDELQEYFNSQNNEDGVHVEYWDIYKKPKNWMVLSILSTVLCCLPLGIAAIINSSKVDAAWNNNDYYGAEEHSHKAQMWCFISIFVGFIASIIYFVKSFL